MNIANWRNWKENTYIQTLFIRKSEKSCTHLFHTFKNISNRYSNNISYEEQMEKTIILYSFVIKLCILNFLFIRSHEEFLAHIQLTHIFDSKVISFWFKIRWNCTWKLGMPLPRLYYQPYSFRKLLYLIFTNQSSLKTFKYSLAFFCTQNSRKF